MNLYHTETPEHFRGRGFAEIVVHAAFEYAKLNGPIVQFVL